MKRSLILFGIICLIVFACTPKEKSPAEGSERTGVNFQKLTLAEAKELAARQDKLVLINFTSPT